MVRIGIGGLFSFFDLWIYFTAFARAKQTANVLLRSRFFRRYDTILAKNISCFALIPLDSLFDCLHSGSSKGM